VPKLVVQPYYRFQYSYYQHNTLLNGVRNDYLNSVGISAAYYFTPWLSLQTFANYNARESDDAFVAKYRAYNIGLDLTAVFRF